MPDIVPTQAVLVSGRTAEATSGATLSVAQAVYRDSSDANKIKLADAATSVATAEAVGLTVTTAVDSSRVIYALSGAVIDVGAVLTQGMMYRLSTVAGALSPVSDAFVSGANTTYCGTAISASQLKLTIDATGVATP